jgi:hypothetical protein
VFHFTPLGSNISQVVDAGRRAQIAARDLNDDCQATLSSVITYVGKGLTLRAGIVCYVQMDTRSIDLKLVLDWRSTFKMNKIIEKLPVVKTWPTTFHVEFEECPDQTRRCERVVLPLL